MNRWVEEGQGGRPGGKRQRRRWSRRSRIGAGEGGERGKSRREEAEDEMEHYAFIRAPGSRGVHIS
jgi:hypothetical protein